MKISAIKTFPINVGFGSQLVVKVETDSGIYGWGASGLSGRELAVIGAIEHFKGFLIGKDARNIGALWQEMYRGQYFEGGRVLTAAISAIDIALYDIKGKALGVPVYELLGGKHRDHVDCFASVRFRTREELFEYSKICIKEGWNMLRLAPAEFEAEGDKELFEPRESIAVIAEWLTDLRREVGSAVTIGIDYHTRLTPAQTYSFIKRMPPGTLDYIEEPIRDENPEAYENLRKMVDIPFTIGEEFSSKWQFLPFLERNLTQYARIDICNVGGITEAMKVASLAEAHYIDLMPHNPLGPICTAATIHMAAASPNFGWLEEMNTPAQYMGTDAPEFYPVRPILDGPTYPVLDTPGLGVEFNEELALEKGFKPIEIPRLRRKDGSFTNW
ncbi:MULTISPECIES: mandelate racemase/muconate lactonizing enzyme family protein [Zobellia]|uniref:mandelate racemase/muconate lactonizing enzyme family protein n=1 Tax=Zobellia TaxID=112040 RepID=UPI001BFF0FDC|nr:MULTISPECIES: mandelate racemase/muconate lactonizing enzyme family protein [Zobellia]MBT9188658.1 mandelate racemase/muconate lactonizing enzyme family protein [Zobellia russellii]MDO6819132.1 mandelate racemase/muconate lactonizing enzyme family protein [Zobellia sp. 1_MG-2023]